MLVEVAMTLLPIDSMIVVVVMTATVIMVVKVEVSVWLFRS